MFRAVPISVIAVALCLGGPAKSWAGKHKLSAVNQATGRSILLAEKQEPRPKRKKRRPPSPARGRRHFYQLRAGAGYRVQDPHHAWGTFTAVMTLEQVLDQHHRRYPKAPDLVIHDLSRRRGGKLHPHVSHRSGRDVDIRLPLSPPSERYVAARPSTLNVERTWFLISALLQTRTIKYIFIDYSLQRVLYRFARARGYTRSELGQIFQYPGHHCTGIIRHEPGHKAHMHVRFLPAPAGGHDLVM